MEIPPMNKTAIISYLDPDKIPKFWNISKLMQKRISMVMERKNIIVDEYSESATKLNGWIQIGQEGFELSSPKEIQKGISNYIIRNKDQLDRLFALNKEIRCERIEFTPEETISCDTVNDLTIGSYNFLEKLKITARRVKSISIGKLFNHDLSEMLSRFEQIDFLCFTQTEFAEIDLSSFKIKKIVFFSINFTQTVKLPYKLDHLQIYDCSGLKHLKMNKVDNFCLGHSYDSDQNQLNFCKSLKEACYFSASLEFPFQKWSKIVPHTVRELSLSYLTSFENVDLLEAKSNLPYLFKISGKVPIELAEALNLRTVVPIMIQTKKKFTFRPREIEIGKSNAIQLSRHPELFEKMSKIVISSKKFDYAVLTDRVKEMEIKYKPNTKSLFLSRYKGECLEI